MASGDQFDYIRPRDIFHENGQLIYPPLAQAGQGVFGLALNKLDTNYYNFITRVWANGTPVPTGLTFGLLLVDDPNNTDAGKVVRIGISGKLLVSGTDDLTTTGFSAETATNITMASTSGVVTLSSVAIANAALDTPAASAHMLIRIRRIGSNAGDTHQGKVLLLGVSVRDT